MIGDLCPLHRDDQRGTGGSPWDGRHTIARHVRSGRNIASYFLLAHPERVAGLIQIAGPFLDPWREADRAAQRARRSGPRRARAGRPPRRLPCGATASPVNAVATRLARGLRGRCRRNSKALCAARTRARFGDRLAWNPPDCFPTVLSDRDPVRGRRTSWFDAIGVRGSLLSRVRSLAAPGRLGPWAGRSHRACFRAGSGGGAPAPRGQRCRGHC